MDVSVLDSGHLGDPDQPALVTCGPDLLKIVPVNLVGNAVKYGRDGGLVHVWVKQAELRKRKGTGVGRVLPAPGEGG
jgi:signal transduction histidine kinase